MWKYGLKTKLVASFALMSIVAITVAGVSTLVSMRRIAEQEIQNKLLLLADAKERQIVAYLDSWESRTLDFSSDGFARNSLSLKEIIDIGSERSGTPTIYLVDKEKNVLAHNQGETASGVDFMDTPPVQKCLDSQEDVAGVYFNKEIIGVSRCFPREGWTLVVEIDAEEALAPVRNATYGMVVTLGLVVIFVILDIYLIAGNIVRPIEKLHEAADIIAQGNLKYEAVIKTGDEIEQLSQAFNQMVVNLKHSRDEIQQYSKGLAKKVAEKTKDLQHKIEDLNKAQEAVLNVAEDAEEARQTVAREKNKIDAILHSIGDGVFVVDSDLNITMVNHVTEKISGFSEKEMIGRKYDSVLKFVFEDSGKANDKFIKEAILTGQTQEMASHILLLRKDGSEVPVADSAALLKDQKGKVIGCVVVFRDVTKEREVDKAKTEFVSLASHQLRTPLSTINWYTELLLGGDAGKPNKEQENFLKEIYKSSKRMVELINALLNVSRLEMGTFSIEPVSVNLEKIAESVLKEIALDISQKKIKLVKNFSSDVPDIQADRSLIWIIFQNLLTNAVKYTPDGGTVALDIERKDGGILIKIRDTGYGIPQNQQDRIFTKFFRADNVREKDSEGTGLGLYIAKSILDQTGGVIGFESVENKGTVFYITLPLEGMRERKGKKKLG